MHRTDAGVQTGPEAELAEHEQRSPELRPWLRMLREIRRALELPGWADPITDLAPAAETRPAPSTPLLQGRTLRADGGALRRLVRALARAAGEADSDAATLAGYRPSIDEARALVEASLRRQHSGIESLAAVAGVSADALATAAHYAALPLLHACERQAAGRIPPTWAHGYCPICGAWPVLAEMRGLEGARRLRCGGCGGDWETEWMRCIFCGERNHERLGSLAPEGELETRRVDTCTTCHGYVKSVATLQPLSPIALMLADLDTVPLDLAADERGFARPSPTGYQLDVRLAARAPRGLLRFQRDG